MHYQANAQIQASLEAVFRYATEHFPVLDDALIPAQDVIAQLEATVKSGGAESLTPADASVVLDLLVGLRQQNATEVPGYFNLDHFETVAEFSRGLAGELTP